MGVLDRADGGGNDMGCLSEEEVAWLTASCERQGVSVKVTDVRVLQRVRTLLSGEAATRTGRQHRRDAGARSTAPLRMGPVAVEAPCPRGAGGDDDVVEHGFHDCHLTVEVERPPLSA